MKLSMTKHADEVTRYFFVADNWYGSDIRNAFAKDLTPLWDFTCESNWGGGLAGRGHTPIQRAESGMLLQ